MSIRKCAQISFVGSKSPKNDKFSALFCKKTINIKLSYGVKFLNDLATSKYNFDQDAHKIPNASLRAPRCARIHMLDLQIKYSNEKSRFYLHTEIDFDFFELKFKVRTLKSRFNEFGPYAWVIFRSVLNSKTNWEALNVLTQT